MKIPRPKSLTVPQIALAVTLGIISGVYIYRPLFVGPDKITPISDKGKKFLKNCS